MKLAGLALLLFGFFLIAVAIGLTLGTAWLITLIVPLSFVQALFISSITIIVIAFIPLQDTTSFGPFEYSFPVLYGPILSLFLAGVAWFLNRMIPLDIWESVLFTTGFTLAIIFGVSRSFYNTRNNPIMKQILREAAADIEGEDIGVQLVDEREVELIRRTTQQMKQAERKKSSKRRL